MAGLIVAIPGLWFSVGTYEFNAFTYPPWTSIILQLVSLTVTFIFVRQIETEKKETETEETEESELQTIVEPAKAIYLSKGVILIFGIIFFNGFFMSSMTYSLPLVMIDGYGWSVLQYSPVWIGISFMGLAGVQIAKVTGKKLRSLHYLIIVPTLGYLCVLCVLFVVGCVGVGRLPKGVGETSFLFAAETSFGALQILQPTLTSIFSQVIPPEYLVRYSVLLEAFALELTRRKGENDADDFSNVCVGEDSWSVSERTRVPSRWNGSGILRSPCSNGCTHVWHYRDESPLPITRFPSPSRSRGSKRSHKRLTY